MAGSAARSASRAPCSACPVEHPELVTCKPGRAEWKLLAVWLAELWPHDEYTAIVAEARRKDGS